MSGELWTTGDIARRLGVTSERARQLTHRPTFPAPRQQAAHIRLWDADDVEQWITAFRPENAEPPRGTTGA
ncbi:hypothetical protein FF36_06373 [Frankia torreyi]|uniref:Transcriptional regulator, AlpA family n=1 Tax=Frankia torreyi TaxID=1856 RepID=A0A0D8B4Y8_9ACTN|nr:MULTISPECIES: RNA polymerase subunit sigma-70 [Frankia]KJE19343.1 hypothetical protein FF36_06373 [Frankia torreyi]KQM01752.1 hypothetical protein FF86_11137 [Frankia sp. CpI1-P]